MNSKICIFGEVLFDQFPDGSRVLGGAPFNVAWHLQALGQSPLFVSAVGDDTMGLQIQQAMRDWGMDLHGLALSPQQVTGTVDIQFVGGEPKYDIVSPSAWDHIEIEEDKVPACKLLYHGSLALRHPHNRDQLQRLTADQQARVFLDVNLRNPWWQREQVLSMVKQCDWLKLNRDELDRLYPSSAALHCRLPAIIDTNQLQGIILTQGAAGAEIMTQESGRHRITPQGEVNVIDTVGAGDAFSSIFLLGLARGWSIDETLSRAQLFASAIVQQRGATVADAAFYQPYIKRWSL